MPRHPPCALHSLSHTPPTQPHPNNQPTRPTNGQPKVNPSISQAIDHQERCQTRDAHTNHKEPPHTHTTITAQACLHTYKQATTPPTPPTTPSKEKAPAGHTGAATRCSRPLSRSQTTTPHPNPHTTGAQPRAGSTEAQDSPSRSRKKDSGLILQNPNSVPPPLTLASVSCEPGAGRLRTGPWGGEMSMFHS
jgi:hypothetical protein